MNATEDIITSVKNLAAFIPLTYITLFHVVNPIGSGILFLNFTPNATDALRKKVSLKIAWNMFMVLTVTLFAGTYILQLFGITIPIVQIGGGLMLASMGWKALYSDDSTNESNQKQIVKDQASSDAMYMSQVFYPLTFPFTIGPACLAATLTISAHSSAHHTSKYYVLGGGVIGILLVSITVYLFYVYSNSIVKQMSPQNRNMLMKLLSFILMCIGGQIMYGGLTGIVQQLKLV